MTSGLYLQDALGREVKRSCHTPGCIAPVHDALPVRILRRMMFHMRL